MDAAKKNTATALTGGYIMEFSHSSASNPGQNPKARQSLAPAAASMGKGRAKPSAWSKNESECCCLGLCRTAPLSTAPSQANSGLSSTPKTRAQRKSLISKGEHIKRADSNQLDPPVYGNKQGLSIPIQEQESALAVQVPQQF